MAPNAVREMLLRICVKTMLENLILANAWDDAKVLEKGDDNGQMVYGCVMSISSFL